MAAPPTLTDIHGIGPTLAKALTSKGIKTPNAVAKASVEKISEIPGFSALRAALTIKSAQGLLGEPTKVKPKSKKTSASKKKDVKKGKGKKKDKKNKDKKGKKGKKGKKKK